MLGTRFFGDFYNPSTNQRPLIGGNTTCRPIGIENFQNITKGGATVQKGGKMGERNEVQCSAVTNE